MVGRGGVIVELIIAGVALGILIWRAAAGARAGRDARGRGWGWWASLGWGLSATAYPAWYWGQARLERMGAEEARGWLAAAAARHRLTRVANVRCPLCDAELGGALTVTATGWLAVRPQANCPRCDFRLDACRHCANFRPALDAIGGLPDMTHGRCAVYRAEQPVETAYPDMARRLAAMGYDTLNAPKPIQDSYLPLEECNRFEPAPARMRQNRVRWLGRERVAAVRLEQRTERFGLSSPRRG
jgi:hypothetical protein